MCVGGGEKKGVKERERCWSVEGKKAGGDGWWKGKKKGNKGEEVGRKGMEEKERRRKR